jgi:uncharacterized membrane protein YagU involved in acid resistance
MQARILSMCLLPTVAWLLWKSIPLKDQKSFKMERQLEDYWSKTLGFIVWKWDVNSEGCTK